MSESNVYVISISTVASLVVMALCLILLKNCSNPFAMCQSICGPNKVLHVTKDECTCQ